MMIRTLMGLHPKAVLKLHAMRPGELVICADGGVTEGTFEDVLEYCPGTLPYLVQAVHHMRPADKFDADHPFAVMDQVDLNGRIVQIDPRVEAMYHQILTGQTTAGGTGKRVERWAFYDQPVAAVFKAFDFTGHGNVVLRIGDKINGIPGSFSTDVLRMAIQAGHTDPFVIIGKNFAFDGPTVQPAGIVSAGQLALDVMQVWEYDGFPLRVGETMDTADVKVCEDATDQRLERNLRGHRPEHWSHANIAKMQKEAFRQRVLFHARRGKRIVRVDDDSCDGIILYKGWTKCHGLPPTDPAMLRHQLF